MPATLRRDSAPAESGNKSICSLGLRLTCAPFNSPGATARTVRKHEPLRRDKRHATRVFNDDTADARVFDAPAELAQDTEVLITMGCGGECPYVPASDVTAGRCRPQRARHRNCSSHPRCSRMSFHAPLDAFVSLLPRGFDNPGRKECLEQEDHDRDHERSACKLGQSELCVFLHHHEKDRH